MGDRAAVAIGAAVSDGHIVDGDLGTAMARVRRGGWAVASEAVAKQEGLRIGQSFTLSLAGAPPARLAAITTNFGWSPGTLVLNADEYRKAWASTTRARSRSTSPPA